MSAYQPDREEFASRGKFTPAEIRGFLREQNDQRRRVSSSKAKASQQASRGIKFPELAARISSPAVSPLDEVKDMKARLGMR